MPGERRKSGELVRQILEALEEHGPMTAIDVCRVLGYERTALSAVLFRMTKKTPRRPKRIYIKGYELEDPGHKRYPRAVFAIGNRPDADVLRGDPKENRRRYDKKKRMLRTTNFVFNLPLKRREFRNEAARDTQGDGRVEGQVP